MRGSTPPPVKPSTLDYFNPRTHSASYMYGSLEMKILLEINGSIEGDEEGEEGGKENAVNYRPFKGSQCRKVSVQMNGVHISGQSRKVSHILRGKYSFCGCEGANYCVARTQISISDELLRRETSPCSEKHWHFNIQRHVFFAGISIMSCTVAASLRKTSVLQCYLGSYQHSFFTM